ncbi:MAG: 4'-phosphopantetheinyl transferase superfamily protein [Cyclobacteriaceae bacterium]
MPLVDLKESSLHGVALWHIAETEDDLKSLAPNDQCPQDIVSPLKRLEWLSGRILIKSLAEQQGIQYSGITKDQFGKPFLKDNTHQISLSHSYPYVAAQIHPSLSVGIDIEQPKDKLLRIASRVLDTGELEDAGADIVKHCIYWCAKEALYKIYGKRGLLFTNHLKVRPFQLQKTGELHGAIEFDNVNVFAELRYIVEPEYVLVFSKVS